MNNEPYNRVCEPSSPTFGPCSSATMIYELFVFVFRKWEPVWRSCYSNEVRAKGQTGRSLSLGALKDFLCSMSPRQALGPVSAGDSFPRGVRRTGREADN
jgi:hypothetical protein